MPMCSRAPAEFATSELLAAIDTIAGRCGGRGGCARVSRGCTPWRAMSNGAPQTVTGEEPIWQLAEEVGDELDGSSQPCSHRQTRRSPWSAAAALRGPGLEECPPAPDGSTLCWTKGDVMTPEGRSPIGGRWGGARADQRPDAPVAAMCSLCGQAAKTGSRMISVTYACTAPCRRRKCGD